MVEKLSLLDRLDVAAPCPADWNLMEGDDRSRFCAECRLNVFNISDMTRDEAENFLLASLKKERVCVRFYKRADGTIITDNCPVGLRKIRDAARRACTLAASCASFLLSLFSSSALAQSADSPERPEMGKRAPVPESYQGGAPHMGDYAEPLSTRGQVLIQPKMVKKGKRPEKAVGPDGSRPVAVPGMMVLRPPVPETTPATVNPPRPELDVHAKVVLPEGWQAKHKEKTVSCVWAVKTAAISWQVNAGILRSGREEFAKNARQFASLKQGHEAAISYNNEANCFYYEGQFSKACATYENALRVLEDVCVDNKPQMTARIMGNLKQAQHLVDSDQASIEKMRSRPVPVSAGQPVIVWLFEGAGGVENTSAFQKQ